MCLFEKGGFVNPEFPAWFENYAKVCTELFSDRVKYFITMNEPQVFLGTGYKEGKFAPFVVLPDADIIKMGHNILLSHGRAVKAIRENAKGDVKIGFSPIGPCVEPKDEREKELEKARFLSFDFDEGNYVFSNSWWSDPVILGDYPAKAYELFGDILKDVIKKGDFEIISQPLDFYGVNIYETKPYSMKGDYLSNTYIGSPRNAMDWPICENALYYSAKFLYDRYKLPIIITENGMPCHDWVHLDGKVHDESRIDFVHRYLNGLKKAAEEGVDVMGYFYWSVMDNFEWSSGYDRRFGLIFVDYRTGERTVKESALWYKKVIESNGEIL
jgi:beta-glucosidase